MYKLFRTIIKTPEPCYRKYHTVEKYEKPCKCIIKCKYSRPSKPLKISDHLPDAERASQYVQWYP